MKFSSLFSGIGGFEAGLPANSFEPILMCENAPSARAVLKARYDGVRLASDVTKLRALPNCDMVTAGWPCQDLSQAGALAGIEGSQSGLVSEIFRLIGQARKKPQLILLENVAFALHLSSGRAILYVTRELEKLGYSWAYRILDSSEFGLAQRRRRIYILAALDLNPAAILFDDCGDQPEAASSSGKHFGFYWTEGNRGLGWTIEGIPPLKGGSGLAIPSPPAIWDRSSRQFFTPGITDAERLQGFRRGWTAPACYDGASQRVRWQLVGNAVSVPVIKWLGQRIIKELGRPSKDVDDKISSSGNCTHNAAFCFRGGKVRRGKISEGPKSPVKKIASEFNFLDAKPLSMRAARGFFRRYANSSLRKNSEFIGDLENYCKA